MDFERPGVLLLFPVVLFFAVILYPPGIFGQPPAPPMPHETAVPLPQDQRTSPVEKISPGVFRIGEMHINKKHKSITFPATVNMEKGLLEYLLVHSGGKTHESLFRTTIRPYDLQIAFLLLGFEGTNSPMAFQGAPERPKGEPVEITVTYQKSETAKATIRPEEWIVKMSGDRSADAGKLDWVYTGSIIVDGQFLAQREGSIIAIFHDPVSMIDNASPGGESDEIWFVKEGSAPAVGTPVTIDIRAKK